KNRRLRAMPAMLEDQSSKRVLPVSNKLREMLDRNRINKTTRPNIRLIRNRLHMPNPKHPNLHRPLVIALQHKRLIASFTKRNNIRFVPRQRHTLAALSAIGFADNRIPAEQRV